MKRHLNTLFVMTQGSYVSANRETVVVKVGEETKLRVPLHALGGVVCFGQVMTTPQLLGRCSERGIAISFLTQYGRFLASVRGVTSGNVLLRREQYRRADQPAGSLEIARVMVQAKLANSRTVLLRALRDYPESGGREALTAAASGLAQGVSQAGRASDLDALRGVEGDAASRYYMAFPHLIVAQEDDFRFSGRNRRPPRDPVNALLSFLYAMLAHDARAACEAVGLDGSVGFLHRDRPGRPGLALDLMEEFRAFLADRVVLSLINRKQVRPKGFEVSDGGGVRMDDTTRKTVLEVYQKRKMETITHPFLGEETTVGLLVHLQARLLARHLRGDLDCYPAFLWK